MISPTVTSKIKHLAKTGTIQLEEREYREGDLNQAYLVIAATDDNNVNQIIAREAERHNLLLNVADVTHLCNFIAPAVVRRGDVTVAISTSGTSPALARKLREEIEGCSLRCTQPFLDYLVEPDTAIRVAFLDGTCNPVLQMENPKVLSTFSSTQLDAIQWDTLEEDVSRCAHYDIVPLEYSTVLKRDPVADCTIGASQLNF